MIVLTREGLDRVAEKGCDAPDCCSKTGPFFLHAVCHVEAGMELSYVPGSGMLTVKCRACKRPICEIEVASAKSE